MIATWTAYAIFLFVGYNSMVPGPLSVSIAETLQVDLSQISYATAALYFGRVMSVQLAPRFLLSWPYKKVFFSLWLFLTGALFLSALSPTFPIFFLGWLCVGVLVGAMTFYANYFIVVSHDKNERTSKLNMLNFFFSIGAISGPFIVGIFLTRDFPWQVPYLIGSVLLLPSLIGLKVNPEILGTKTNTSQGESFTWKPSLVWLTISLLGYMIAETGFFFWIVPYLREVVEFPVDKAAFSLSIFWIFMGIGRFMAGRIAKKMRLDYFLYSFLILAILGYWGTILVPRQSLIFFLVGLTGLGCSALYATILSLGTQLFDNPSPKLVSTLVNIGTLGTVSGLVLYGFLKNFLTIPSLLTVGGVSMILSLVAITQTFRTNRKNTK